MNICQSVNANVSGQKMPQSQTGRSYQSRRRSGVFAGSMLRSSAPSATSKGPASMKKNERRRDPPTALQTRR